MERLSYKVDVTYVNVHDISRRLKEELVWVIDKHVQLRLIINKMLFKIVIPLRI